MLRNQKTGTTTERSVRERMHDDGADVQLIWLFCVNITRARTSSFFLFSFMQHLNGFHSINECMGEASAVDEKKNNKKREINANRVNFAILCIKF